MKTYCSKMSYPTKAEALKGIDVIRRDNIRFAKKYAKSGKRGTDGYKKLRAYQCPLCEQWHLTTMKQKHALRGQG